MAERNEKRWKVWAALGLLAFLLLLTAILAIDATAYRTTGPTDPAAYERGMEAFGNNDLEVAIREWRKVPRDHPQYAKAMRFIGWEIHGRLGDYDAVEGLSYVNAALLAAPLDGNVWQDSYRAYAKAIGLDVR